MREFKTAEFVCRDREGNEAVVYEISKEENFGSAAKPDFRVQKDRYETFGNMRVISLDGSTFQVFKTGLILHLVRKADKRTAA